MGVHGRTFFILFGYFTYKYVEEIGEKSGFAQFFKKKYMRFLPMLVISGIVCLILEYIYFVKVMREQLPYTIWGIVTSLLGISRWLNSNYMVNNPMWYISVLLFCYAVFFFLTNIAKRLKINPYILYCIMIYLGVEFKVMEDMGKAGLPIFSSAMGRGYSCFFFGIVLRYLFEKYRVTDKIINLFLSFIWIWAFIHIYRTKQSYIGNVFDLWAVVSFLVFPAIIIVFKNKYVSKLFYSDVLKNLGGISFNAYVWHLPILRLLLIVSNLVILELDNYIDMLMVTFIIFVVGIFSYFFIEKTIKKKIDLIGYFSDPMSIS